MDAFYSAIAINGTTSDYDAPLPARLTPVALTTPQNGRQPASAAYSLQLGWKLTHFSFGKRHLDEFLEKYSFDEDGIRQRWEMFDRLSNKVTVGSRSRSGSSFDPGLPKTVVIPNERRTSQVASRTALISLRPS